MTELHWWQTHVRVRIHAYLHIYKQERDKSRDLNLFVISVVTRCTQLRKPSNINPFSATKITEPPRHVLLHLKLSYLTCWKGVFLLYFYDQKIDIRAIIDSVYYHQDRQSLLSMQLPPLPTLHHPTQGRTLLINYGRQMVRKRNRGTRRSPMMFESQRSSSGP
jgi:hypothetical protein